MKRVKGIAILKNKTFQQRETKREERKKGMRDQRKREEDVEGDEEGRE